MFEEWAKDPDKVGGIAFLVMLVVALVRGWLVPKLYYTQKCREAEFYREIAFRGTNLAERSSKAKEILRDNSL